MNVQPFKNVFASYRNGFYQGQMKDNKRHGFGILILDESVILVANWKDDLAYGIGFCYLNNEQYGFLQFNRGELQGSCIFRSNSQLLVMQFNNGRAVDRHLLINNQQQVAKILIYQNANYEIIESIGLKNMTQSQFVEKAIGIKLTILPLADFLFKYFCNQGQFFQIKMLSNGNYLFRFLEKSSTLNLGFVFNKNQQLISYGIYSEEKLHGFGCKYENNVKYQGQFQNGILNGEGLKFSNGKYTYGHFQNGNLVEALFLEERSNASEEKLKQFKRIYHIQSPQFYNGYISKRIINFKGIHEINAMSSPIKQYLYNNINQNVEQNINKNNNSISLNLLLSGKEKNDSPSQHRFDNGIRNNKQMDNKLSNSQTRYNNIPMNPQVARKFNF